MAMGRRAAVYALHVQGAVHPLQRFVRRRLGLAQHDARHLRQGVAQHAVLFHGESVPFWQGQHKLGGVVDVHELRIVRWKCQRLHARAAVTLSPLPSTHCPSP